MNKKVLIVDDDKDFLSELKEMLCLSGYEVVEVDDPNEVGRVARAERPHIILLDINMPNKNGFQVAKELKDTAELAGTPVLIMSAYFSKGPASLAGHGIKKFLHKPFNPLDVIAEIEKHTV